MDAESLFEGRLKISMEKKPISTGISLKKSPESPRLKLFCGWEVTKGGTADACSVPTPTQSTCLHCRQDLSGLSPQGACMGSVNKFADKKVKRMQTKHI